MNTPIELMAVVLGIAYLLLAMVENKQCWYAAGTSAMLFFLLFTRQSFYMSAFVQLYYLLMAIYGWYQWTGSSASSSELVISRWRITSHIKAICIIMMLTMLSGYFLSQFTSAKAAYIDSFITFSSIVTTYMVTKKILDNWLYWIVIDSVATIFYYTNDLKLTAFLFFTYAVIAVIGFIRWRNTSVKSCAQWLGNVT